MSQLSTANFPAAHPNDPFLIYDGITPLMLSVDAWASELIERNAKSDFILRTVTHIKRTFPPHHDFLVFRFAHKSGSSACIAAERTIENIGDQLQSSGANNSSAVSPTSPTLISDRISISNGDSSCLYSSTDDEILATLSFPQDTPFTATNVAVLLNVVSKAYLTYGPFDEQCYRFVSIVWHIMCIKWNGVEELTHSGKRQRYDTLHLGMKGPAPFLGREYEREWKEYLQRKGTEQLPLVCLFS
jgi:hypothetical protein